MERDSMVNGNFLCHFKCCGGVNSCVLYQFAQRGEIIKRFDFIKTLGLQLIDENLCSRIATNKKVSSKVRKLIAEILGIEIPIIDDPRQRTNKSKRKRCAICPSRKDRKTAIQCDLCKLPICNQCCKKIWPIVLKINFVFHVTNTYTMCLQIKN
jgi:hypothetical protein